LGRAVEGVDVGLATVPPVGATTRVEELKQVPNGPNSSAKTILNTIQKPCRRSDIHGYPMFIYVHMSSPRKVNKLAF
jgi:hypothetical protein